MKLIIGLWIKKYYKWIEIFLVIFSLFIIMAWYCNSSKSDSIVFIIPIVFSLILYFIGFISNIISDDITISLPYYAKKYNDFKKIYNLLNASTQFDTEEFIIFLKGFIGKTGIEYYDNNSYIPNDKYVFKKIYFDTIDNYSYYYNKTSDFLNSVINKHLIKNNNSFSVDNELILNTSKWCEDNFEGNFEIKNDIISLLSVKKREFDLFLFFNNEVKRQNIASLKRCNKALTFIEEIYKDRLIDYLELEELDVSNIDIINNKLDDLGNNIQMIDDHLSESNLIIEELNENYNSIKDSIDDILHLMDNHFEEDID